MCYLLFFFLCYFTSMHHSWWHWSTVTSPASWGPSNLCHWVNGGPQSTLSPLWVVLHLQCHPWATYHILPVRSDIQGGETCFKLIYSAAEKPLYYMRWRNVFPDYLETYLWPSANHFVTFNWPNCRANNVDSSVPLLFLSIASSWVSPLCRGELMEQKLIKGVVRGIE